MTIIISFCIFRSEKNVFLITSQVKRALSIILKVCSINSVSFPLIRLDGNVTYREKSFVDILNDRNPLELILLRTSPEFLIDQNVFSLFLS